MATYKNLPYNVQLAHLQDILEKTKQVIELEREQVLKQKVEKIQVGIVLETKTRQVMCKIMKEMDIMYIKHERVVCEGKTDVYIQCIQM